MTLKTDPFKILIVDDEPANIWVLIEELEKEFDIRCVTEGDEALEIARSENQPDLILLDIIMPGMDGYEVLSRLKADEKTRGIPVVFVTAKNEDWEEVKGIELGAQDYVIKPFNVSIVKARIKNILNLKREEDRRLMLREQLLKMNSELQIQVKEKIEQLNAARQELRKYEEKYNHLFERIPEHKDRETILVVDDIPENIQILIENLESEYTIICAKNGEEALDLVFSDKRPDLVLLDIMMPGMDGYEVCARLKARPDTWDLPVIFLTALSQEEDESKGLNIGGVDFITKPFHPPVVKARVKAALRLNREMQNRMVLTRKLAELNQTLEVRIQEKAAELIKAREDLEHSEEKYRSIYENAIEGIYRSTPDGRLISASPALARILGYDSDREMTDMIHDVANQLYYRSQDRDIFIKALEEKGEITNFEARFKKKNGDYIWGMLCAKRLRENSKKEVYYQGFLIDITERKAVERQIERLQKHMQNIIDHMPSILAGVDTKGRVTHWNREAEKRTGIDAEHAMGALIKDVYPGLNGDSKLVTKTLETLRPAKLTKVLSQDSRENRYSDITVYPLVPDKCEGAVIRIDDVTEQVRMEEMMIQSEKMLSLGGLAAGMAHEINNPLSGIIQCSQVIKNRISNKLPVNEEIAEKCNTSIEAISRYMEERGVISMFDAIMDSGRRAAQIVNNMLSFARKDDGHFSAHDLSELVNLAITLATADYDMKKKYDFKQIEIVRQFDPELSKVPCDPSKLQQVFFNILKNGAQAMAENTKKKEQNRFVIRLAREGGRVRIEIEDNGPGMTPLVKRRLFEPFFTTKERGVGTGLGLSVSYFIITDTHGGEMRVESTPGNGARFIIYLPLQGKDI